MNEFNLIEWIQKKAGRVPPGWIGIGDDAALIRFAQAGNCVISTDTLVEGVDFNYRVTPEQAGRKALAINLSDMAAMGAIPSAFLMTLGVPQSWKLAKLKKFLNGVFCLAKSAQTVCIGGDISSARQFFCSITILGKPSRAGAILRKGAKAGDFVFVTGSFGGSIRHKHYAFTPRVKEAQWLAQNCRPSAMLDVSDGLAQDLTHLLTASHVCARLDLETIPLSVQAGNLSSALSDGEDFELLFTVSSKQAPRLEKSWKRAFPRVALTCIGRIIPGKPQIRFFKNGIEQKKFYSKPGFRHF